MCDLDAFLEENPPSFSCCEPPGVKVLASTDWERQTLTFSDDACDESPACTAENDDWIMSQESTCVSQPTSKSEDAEWEVAEECVVDFETALKGVWEEGGVTTVMRAAVAEERVGDAVAACAALLAEPGASVRFASAVAVEVASPAIDALERAAPRALVAALGQLARLFPRVFAEDLVGPRLASVRFTPQASEALMRAAKPVPQALTAVARVAAARPPEWSPGLTVLLNGVLLSVPVRDAFAVDIATRLVERVASTATLGEDAANAISTTNARAPAAIAPHSTALIAAFSSIENPPIPFKILLTKLGRSTTLQ